MIKLMVKIPLDELRQMVGVKYTPKPNSRNPCLMCGKEIKSKKFKQVHLMTSGEVLSYDGDDVEGSQGFFPVGNECSKKLNLRFAF